MVIVKHGDADVVTGIGLMNLIEPGQSNILLLNHNLTLGSHGRC